MSGYEVIDGGTVPIKAWVRGVPIEEGALGQLRQTASMSVVSGHGIAVMPDVHYGRGSTVGSVVPTVKAVIPSVIGVDIGCGMVAVKTTLTSNALGDNGQRVFDEISKRVPHGRTNDGGKNDRGAWTDIPNDVGDVWNEHLAAGFAKIVERSPKLESDRKVSQFGTLGSGNHFVCLAIDEQDFVWVVVHSGSRGIGNKIGSHFISLAKQDMEKQGIKLPNWDLAYLQEGSENFDAYIEGMLWAQEYARLNRNLMLWETVSAMKKRTKSFKTEEEAINCHHNYCQMENHFGQDVWLARKGAISAREGQLGIIPQAMGKKVLIVRGKGNADSYCSSSHGAGRIMSRTEARAKITLDQHRKDTEGTICRKDKDVVDESPSAYKDIDAVMNAQSDLVEIVHSLQEIICIKG
jgi:tRNA-splicing ligase RtcB